MKAYEDIAMEDPGEERVSPIRTYAFKEDGKHENGGISEWRIEHTLERILKPVSANHSIMKPCKENEE